MNDTYGESINIMSTWKEDKMTTDSGTSCNFIETKNAYTSTVTYTSVECQTIAEETEDLETDVFSIDGWKPASDISSFITNVSPLLLDQLTQNLHSHAFDDYDSFQAVDDGDVNCRYRLIYDWNNTTSNASSSSSSSSSSNAAYVGGKEKVYDLNNNMQCTGVDWNSTGSTIAVAYGRLDHEGWCNHTSGVCCWNIFHKDFKETIPTIILEASSCVLCVACHPEHPALVAGGTFNGEIIVWSLSQDTEDSVLLTSEIGDYFHREPVNSIRWVHNPQTKEYEIVSISGDGKILFWSMKNNLSYPMQGFLLLNQNRKYGGSNGEPLLAGGTAIGFDGGVPGTIGSNTFIVGSEGGALLRYFYNPSTVEPSLGESKWSEEASRVLSRVDVSSRSDVIKSVDKHTRHNSITTVSPIDIFESRPALNKLYNEASHFSFQPFIGAVHSIDCSPFHRNLFLSAGSDGTVGVYSVLESKPLLSLEPSDSSLFACGWSKVRPLVFGVGAGDGGIYIYDMKVSKSEPTIILQDEEGTCDKSAVLCLSFNRNQRDFLASGDEKGVVRIWQLSWGLSNVQTREQNTLDSIAKMIDNNYYYNEY